MVATAVKCRHQTPFMINEELLDRESVIQQLWFCQQDFSSVRYSVFKRGARENCSAHTICSAWDVYTLIF
ncbi:unnamed protein product [Lactuca virosa]|uniref:Uncharacterized protein n=1 Tax=Lactuca virosa TaxID=75947 RepID=A0AAU9M546_9ASTR|nr:unnamed protein product [Lactuca virosa]